jgi:fermentation-respiration switch protein FrsA (DUF1100 family)
VKLLKRLAMGLIVLVVIAYLGFIAGLYFLQRDFQYTLTGEVTALDATKLAGVETVAIPTADGETINGWYGAPQAGKPVIIYYKGNSGSFSYEHERFEAWMADGYGFLAFDYRGFPLSPGKVNQTNILADALAAFDWVVAKGQPIVIWGRSLGTGPATYVASQREAEALLLETPFLSAVKVAAERYPFAPVGWLMQDQFPLNEWILDVAEPVFVAHGTADRTIGVSNGERVYALVPNKYDLWIEEGADHSDLWDRGIWGRAKKFFEAAAMKVALAAA